MFARNLSKHPSTFGPVTSETKFNLSYILKSYLAGSKMSKAGDTTFRDSLRACCRPRALLFLASLALTVFVISQIKLDVFPSPSYGRRLNPQASRPELLYQQDNKAAIPDKSSKDASAASVQGQGFPLEGEEAATREPNVKRILYWSTRYFKACKTCVWGEKRIQCGRNVCEFTENKELLDESHALIFHGWLNDMPTRKVKADGVIKYVPNGIPPRRNKDQYWVLFVTEPPIYLPPHLEAYNGLFNWTMTYRVDSDIFLPYGKFVKRAVPIKEAPSREKHLPPTKTKLVSHLSSHCGGIPSRRNEMVKALFKHIPVDIYGACGKFNCSTPGIRGYDCKEELGKQYKFYLAFENSLCQDYVTEKMFQAFAAGMVPVVYGGASYDLFAPRGSLINVNSFPTAKSLADYLLYLDKHDDEYLKFFEWTKSYEVLKDFTYEESHCYLCNKLHSEHGTGKQRVYTNLTDWVYTNGGKYPICVDPVVWS